MHKGAGRESRHIPVSMYLGAVLCSLLRNISCARVLAYLTKKKIMSKIEKIILFLIAVSFGAAIYLYPQMPEMMASHWNAGGEADGYMPKAGALFFMPGLSLVFFFLFSLIPKIDPMQANIEKFRGYFDIFILLFEVFFLYIYFLTIVWSLGWRFDMTAAMLPALALLFYSMSILLGKAERNFFIGIRTPWTLSSDRVWDKTHARGSQLFRAVAVLTFLGVFAADYAIYFMLVPVLGASLYLIVYSYLEFRKEKTEKDGRG